MEIIKNGGCWSNKSIYAENDSYYFITADGTAIQIRSGNILIDIDGPQKGQNKMGFDIFVFEETNNEIMPFCYDMKFEELLTLAADYSNNGEGALKSASAWIINYDNMDYLKITKDKKCPNGTTPTEQNPRCK